MKMAPRGITLIELLIAIALIMLVLGTFIGLFLGEAKRSTCAEQLGRVHDATQLSLANPGDRVLCMNLKTLTKEYNAVCGKVLGELQVIECP